MASNKLQFLKEEVEVQGKFLPMNRILLEENSKSKDLFLEGIMMVGNVKNRNGRVYPLQTLIKEANRYDKELVAQNRAFGELSHSDSPVVKLPNVSHMITKLWVDGNNVRGRIKILPTPMGQIARQIIESGGQLGVSTRGMGSVNEETGEVGDNFFLAAIDIVADPSAPGAQLNITESVDPRQVAKLLEHEQRKQREKAFLTVLEHHVKNMKLLGD